MLPAGLPAELPELSIEAREVIAVEQPLEAPLPVADHEAALALVPEHPWGLHLRERCAE